MTITRKYDTYTFTVDGKTICVMDYSDNSAPIYIGRSGKRISQSTIESYHKDIPLVVRIIEFRQNESATELLNRAISMIPDVREAYVALQPFSPPYCADLLEHWREVVQWFTKKLYNDGQCTYIWSYEDFIRARNYREIKQKLNAKIWEYVSQMPMLKVTIPQVWHIIEKYNTDYCNFTAKQKEFIERYVLPKEVAPYLYLNKKTYNLDGLIKFTRHLRELDSVEKTLRERNIECPPINYKELETTIRDLHSLLKAEASKRFGDFQTQYPLNYENDRFKVKVPTSRAELADIGNYFRNCANGYEWENYLQNQMRFLVIVVDKQDNKPCACVDIDAKTFKIMQYLGKGNSNTHGETYDFRSIYQVYLDTLK